MYSLLLCRKLKSLAVLVLNLRLHCKVCLSYLFGRISQWLEEWFLPLTAVDDWWKCRHLEEGAQDWQIVEPWGRSDVLLHLLILGFHESLTYSCTTSKVLLMLSTSCSFAMMLLSSSSTHVCRLLSSLWSSMFSSFSSLIDLNAWSKFVLIRPWLFLILLISCLYNL